MTCDGGSTQFAAYLLRYTAQRKKQLEANPPGTAKSNVINAIDMGTEVKAPGTGDAPKNWAHAGDPRFAKLVFSIKCPGGKGEAEPVIP